MEKDKITFLKEKEISRKAKENAEFLENACMQNPIQAKFLSFQKLKKRITIKDLI